MMSFFKLSLFGAIFMTALSGGISQAQQTPPSQWAVELESANPVPDTKISVFLRQENEKGTDANDLPLIQRSNGGFILRVSVFSQTAYGKPGVQSFIFERSRSNIRQISVEATCRCIGSPVVTTEPYEFDADSPSLDDPLISLYVMSNGTKFGPYAVRPLELKDLKPIGAFNLQSELNRR